MFFFNFVIAWGNCDWLISYEKEFCFFFFYPFDCRFMSWRIKHQLAKRILFVREDEAKGPSRLSRNKFRKQSSISCNTEGEDGEMDPGNSGRVCRLFFLVDPGRLAGLLEPESSCPVTRLSSKGNQVPQHHLLQIN